jgi:hypothetical protein
LRSDSTEETKGKEVKEECFAGYAGPVNLILVSSFQLRSLRGAVFRASKYCLSGFS